MSKECIHFFGPLCLYIIHHELLKNQFFKKKKENSEKNIITIKKNYSSRLSFFSLKVTL